MIKKFSILLIGILLFGCTPEEEASVKLTDFETYEIEMTENYEALNNRIDQMQMTIDDSEIKLAEKDKTIDRLMKRITDLEASVEQSDIHWQVMQYQNNYMEYRLDFVTDLLQEFEGYSTLNGFITNYDETNGMIEIDVLEYVAYYDEERIKELNIDVENELIIAGAYIYNSPEDNRLFPLSKNTKILFHKENEPGEMVYKSAEELKTRLSETNKVTFTFHLVDNVVVRVVERFHD